MKQFLEALEETGGLLFEEGGKEGIEKIDPGMKAALDAQGIKATWAYEPEGYDLVVLEHDKDGEKPKSWSVAFFTEAEARGGEEEKIFDEKVYEAAAKKPKMGMKIVNHTQGNFLDIVQLCIELASNKQFKGGFTAQKAQKAVSAAKAKK